MGAGKPVAGEPITSAQLPTLQRRAIRQVGFLIGAYRCNCWYWEVVELARKLALTSSLALIAPGSAGQVVVGLLIAFSMLIADLVFAPCSTAALNTFNQMSQVNLFMILLVALLGGGVSVVLLLKVNLDGDSSASFYSGIVSFLSIAPVALPSAMSLYLKFVVRDLEATDHLQRSIVTIEDGPRPDSVTQ